MKSRESMAREKASELLNRLVVTEGADPFGTKMRQLELITAALLEFANANNVGSGSDQWPSEEEIEEYLASGSRWADSRGDAFNGYAHGLSAGIDWFRQRIRERLSRPAVSDEEIERKAKIEAYENVLLFYQARRNEPDFEFLCKWMEEKISGHRAALERRKEGM